MMYSQLVSGALLSGPIQIETADCVFQVRVGINKRPLK